MFNPNARRYAKQELLKTYQLNEKEKKRLCNERIMQVEHGTFILPVVSAQQRNGTKIIEILFAVVGLEKTEKRLLKNLSLALNNFLNKFVVHVRKTL